MFLSYFLHYNRYLNIFGILLTIGFAIAFSFNRKKIKYRLIVSCLVMQFVLAFFILRFPLGKKIIEWIAIGIAAMYQFADHGTSFVFGRLVSADSGLGFIFAFKVLPITIFFSAFTALLIHFKIIQLFVSGANALMRPFLSVSASENAVAVANSFLGQTEAPLLVRHHLKHMTKSEFFVVMVSGMATISSALLAVYGAMGVPVIHLLASSIMSIPGAIMLAKIIVPDGHGHDVAEQEKLDQPMQTRTMFDAIASGTSDGLMMALHIGAFLISFLALLALANALLGSLSSILNIFLPNALQLPSLTLEKILAYLFAPFGYLLGFTGNEALIAGQLLGLKVAVNELIAYTELVKLSLSERTLAILTYVLCGFSNFCSIGIQMSAIGILAPDRRSWIAQLGLYSIVAAALSNLITAMIAALLL